MVLPLRWSYQARPQSEAAVKGKRKRCTCQRCTASSVARDICSTRRKGDAMDKRGKEEQGEAKRHSNNRSPTATKQDTAEENACEEQASRPKHVCVTNVGG